MQDLFERFRQNIKPPQRGNSQLQTQIVETELRAVMAFGWTIIVSFKKCEAMRLVRDNFLLSLILDGAYLVRERPIPELMFSVLGWHDDVLSLILKSPVRLPYRSTLQLIGQIKGSPSQWVREISVS